MKKSLVIATSLILILALLIPAASAQDEEQRAGITPDSIFYFLDVFFDNVRATLTPTLVGKATARLDILQERMAEMEIMAYKNKTTEANKAKVEGEKQMEEFESSISRARSKDAAGLNESIQTYAKTLEIFKQRLRNYDQPDYADAIADALRMLETSENIIANIPEDFDPESTFIIISGPPGSRPPDPHNCSGHHADNRIKYCCEDSDEDYSLEHREKTDNRPLDYYYTKGTVEYKVIRLIDRTALNDEIIEDEIYTDSCDGNTLTEWECAKRDRMTSEEYDCPHGCEDGACIPGREELKEGEYEMEVPENLSEDFSYCTCTYDDEGNPDCVCYRKEPIKKEETEEGGQNSS